jgi:acetyltransferase-like isoleucine patch superfamily enzyme
MKRSLKRLAAAIATVMIFPVYLAYLLGGLVIGPEEAFEGTGQALSLLPGRTGAYLRRAFFRLTLADCAPDVLVCFGALVTQRDTRLGRGVRVGEFCCLGHVDLGDDVLLASHVSITSGGQQHGIDRLDIPIRFQPGTASRVTIGEDSWIGERSVVMANVGKHCVIGAGSVVVREVPDYAIAAGVPARVIRLRTTGMKEETSCPNGTR